MEVEKHKRTIGYCSCFVVLLLVAVFALAIALGVVASRLKDQPDSCPTSSNIALDPPDNLPPFYDLTHSEIQAVKRFLYGQKELNLVKPSVITLNSSYIFSFELLPPIKQEALDYLDNGNSQPVREARVVIFRGDSKVPVSEEYTVGPTANPTYMKDKGTFPFRYRPLTEPETVAAITLLHAEIGGKANAILLESYGGKLGDCSDNCLGFEMITPMSSSASGEPMNRKMWYWLAPTVEFWSLNSLDFVVRVDLTSSDPDQYYIDRIFHAKRMFRSVDELVQAYNANTFAKTRVNYPKADRNLFSSLNRRGTLFPSEPLSPPQEFEPDGKRYSIKGRHIQYMGWDFDVRMSTLFGPQLFDIRFDDKRILYELSLQECAAFYSANSPEIRFAAYTDSVALIGTRARSLVPGGDCPVHATFLSANHVIESQEAPMVVDRAFCVFEHNTATPLRRHLTSFGGNKFYEGMLDSVLIVRTVATVINYDYIFDFIFHQNGAVEVKAISTGYILASFRFPPENEYGFALNEHITGNIHHHMFNFKVDMDINGQANRFETIEVRPEVADNTLWSASSGAKYSQTKMVRKQIKNEASAAVNYNLSTPKYLTFYNDKVKTRAGVPRANRLLMKGMSKQMVTTGTGQEPSVSWARHQLAVTRYKDSERRSSSIYACYDGENPVVDFQDFMADNESISDVDQVAWVTMGVHHIPRMEDQPVTPTVGLDLRFFLLPYNYFDEDPAIGSGDAIRVEPRDQNDLNAGLRVERYGRKENAQCMPQKSAFDEELENKPESLFDKPTGDFTI
ncbi:putative amine oxidase [copper-containing] [Mya arenaria]|uniref:putative amine oxidase [copper-containing] n=1 Tax=Mya arenaria TaxID=6604 RepID=UPI0022E2F128|nr:putative amine oxidase [copper-containing] [Mya arenaria]